MRTDKLYGNKEITELPKTPEIRTYVKVSPHEDGEYKGIFLSAFRNNYKTGEYRVAEILFKVGDFDKLTAVSTVRYINDLLSGIDSDVPKQNEQPSN